MPVGRRSKLSLPQEVLIAKVSFRAGNSQRVQRLSPFPPLARFRQAETGTAGMCSLMTVDTSSMFSITLREMGTTSTVVIGAGFRAGPIGHTEVVLAAVRRRMSAADGMTRSISMSGMTQLEVMKLVLSAWMSVISQIPRCVEEVLARHLWAAAFRRALSLGHRILESSIHQPLAG